MSFFPQRSELPQAHAVALFTVFVWGTTFVATKYLLRDFSPITILFLRFVMGTIALAFVPGRLKFISWKTEALLAAAGLTGVTLYFLLENIALKYTFASNVGILVTVSPFITALLSRVFLKEEKELGARFFIGFVVALAGVAMISLNGSMLRLNPRGDVLALLAAATWSVYSILMKKVGATGLPVVLCTRRTFLYGLIFMLPVLSPLGFSVSADALMKPANAATLVFLGIGAGAICFATWNYAVKILGAVRTNIYIYLIPVVTAVTSIFVLGEKLTPLSVGGIALTLAGLFISERRATTRQG